MNKEQWSRFHELDVKKIIKYIDKDAEGKRETKEKSIKGRWYYTGRFNKQGKRLFVIKWENKITEFISVNQINYLIKQSRMKIRTDEEKMMEGKSNMIKKEMIPKRYCHTVLIREWEENKYGRHGHYMIEEKENG